MISDNLISSSELVEVSNDLRHGEQKDAVKFICDYLISGSDCPAMNEFVIGEAGALLSSPTLRVYFLDLLSSLDPIAARDISTEILSSPTTPDEWAIALRNIGRTSNSPSDHDFLRRKAEELIANPIWQSAPTVGYLHSFDILVHTNSVESMPILSSLVQKLDRKDLAHASFITIDRLAQSKPLQTLEFISHDASLQKARPEMCAQILARADLRDDQQRLIISNWLLDPSRTTAELRAFTGVFPNRNQFISQNLLTKQRIFTEFERLNYDTQAIKILNSWRIDPVYQRIAPHLDEMLRRLNLFTNSSSPR